MSVTIPERWQRRTNGHGYGAGCECDLEGGDPDCQTQPPYETISQYIDRLLDGIAKLEREVEQHKKPRMFPVQNRLYRDEIDKTKPGPPQIPWEIAEKVYAAYSTRFGTSQSLERLGQRGGFGLAEMDMLYPKWRDDVDEIIKLRAITSQQETIILNKSAAILDMEAKFSAQERLKNSIAFLAAHTEGEARCHVEIISGRLGFGHAADIVVPKEGAW